MINIILIHLNYIIILRYHIIIVIAWQTNRSILSNFCLLATINATSMKNASCTLTNID